MSNTIQQLDEWGPRVYSENLETSSRNFFDDHKTKIIVLVAIAALGLLISSGTLSFLGMKSLLTYGLFAGGGVFVVTDAILLLYLLFRSKKTEQDSNSLKATDQAIESKINQTNPHNASNALNLQRNQEYTYNIYTWNIGLKRDFKNTLCIHQAMVNDNQSFEDAYKSSSKEDSEPTLDELSHRKELFKSGFATFEGADIICLQESYQYSITEIQQMLPGGYDVYSYKRKDENIPERNSGQCCVIWNTQRFSKIDEAKLIYDDDKIPSLNSSPNTMLHLKDNHNGFTFCVTSAHLRGFNLTRIGQSTMPGDNQLNYELEVAHKRPADVYIVAGDYNVTHQHYKPRLQFLENKGYVTPFKDTDPTIYDAHLKDEKGAPLAVKLDHIYAKSSETIELNISQAVFNKTALTNFNRPSDHIPVGAQLKAKRLEEKS